MINSKTLLLIGWFVCTTAIAGSETPPKGPPWHREFSKAQLEALSAGKPIFLYFTKTY